MERKVIPARARSNLQSWRHALCSHKQAIQHSTNLFQHLSSRNRAKSNGERRMQSMRLLAKAFALVLGMLLVSSMLGTAQHARAQSAGRIKPTLREAIVNGGFEMGDLTGWTVNPGNGSVAVVMTNPYAGNYCTFISGLKSLYQGFVGIPTSSIQSMTYCKRAEPESTRWICNSFTQMARTKFGKMSPVHGPFSM